MDWRAAARTDRLYVKRFHKETDMSAYLLVDASASMGFAGGAPEAKLTYAGQLAAALAYLLSRQGDRPALGLAREALAAYVPPGSGARHLREVVGPLETAEPSGVTDLPAALRQLFAVARRRGMLVLVSDLLDDPAALFRALSLFRHRGFAVSVIHLLSPDELSLPADQPTRFFDPETGAEVEADPAEIRAAYAAELGRHLSALEDGAKARGIRYNRIGTATPVAEALWAYVAASS